MVGQASTPQASQIAMCPSTTMAWRTSYWASSSSRRSPLRSFGNLGLSTPTTETSSGRKCSSMACRTGSVCRQLMQQLVQKSTTVTRPCRSFIVSGRETFSQSVPPAKPGAVERWATGTSGLGPWLACATGAWLVWARAWAIGVACASAGAVRAPPHAPKSTQPITAIAPRPIPCSCLGRPRPRGRRHA